MTPLESEFEQRNQFRTNDSVRLLNRLGDLPSGSAGRIVGCFARSEPTYVVSFAGTQPCVEVRSDEIIHTNELGAAA